MRGAAGRTGDPVTPLQRTPSFHCPARIANDKIAALVNEHFDPHPKGIILMLGLPHSICEKPAAHGYGGRDEPQFSWVKTDKAPLLRSAAGL